MNDSVRLLNNVRSLRTHAWYIQCFCTVCLTTITKGQYIRVRNSTDMVCFLQESLPYTVLKYTERLLIWGGGGDPSSEDWRKSLKYSVYSVFCCIVTLGQCPISWWDNSATSEKMFWPNEQKKRNFWTVFYFFHVISCRMSIAITKFLKNEPKTSCFSFQ